MQRRVWRLLLAAGGVAAIFAVFYNLSPHKSLLRRKLMPGYWLLAAQGKINYDPDLRILRHGNPDLPEIAITIDDGPHPENSIPLLDVLKAAHVPATFFVVGTEVKAHPEIVRRMVAEGHEVGSHTQEHSRLPTLSNGEVRKTLGYADINVRLATNGYRMKTLRPPGGEIDARTATLAKDLGYTSILWSDTSGDYEVQSPDLIVREVMDGAENGAIIILHDAHQETVQALPILIQRLKEQGFKLVTVSEMLKHTTQAQK